MDENEIIQKMHLDKHEIEHSENSYISALPQIMKKLGLWDIPSTFNNSLSWYQALKYVLNYIITKVIPPLEENDTKINNLIDYYGEVVDFCNNYFDNLDVQDEINNKLDTLALDGTLSSLIAPMITGSPKIVNHESDLNSSLDKTAIYVAIDTGHKYYWNGTIWVDFGTYQATAIGDDDISSENIKNLIYDKIDFNTKELSTNSSNIFQPNNVTKTTDGTSTTYEMSANGGVYYSFQNLDITKDLYIIVEIENANLAIICCKSNDFSLNYKYFCNGINVLKIPKENIGTDKKTGILLYNNPTNLLESGNSRFTVKSIKYTQSSLNNKFFNNNLSNTINNVNTILNFENIEDNIDYLDFNFKYWGNILNYNFNIDDKTISFKPTSRNIWK